MTDRIVVDTNVLLRLLLNDHPIQSSAVDRWFERSVARRRPEAVILQVVIVELLRVLRAGPYGFPHAQLVSTVEWALGLPATIEGRDVVESALGLYRQSLARDWEDCLIAAHAIAHADGALATYDRRLAQLPGLTVITP